MRLGAGPVLLALVLAAAPAAAQMPGPGSRGTSSEAASPRRNSKSVADIGRLNEPSEIVAADRALARQADRRLTMEHGRLTAEAEVVPA